MIGERLLSELEKRGYFDLLDQEAEEIYYRLNQARLSIYNDTFPHDALPKLANDAIARINLFTEGANHHYQNALELQKMIVYRRLPLWDRLSNMYFMNSALMNTLANATRKLRLFAVSRG